MRRSLLVAAACALACLSSVVAGFIELDPTTGHFIDSTTGSTQLYHGVNVVYKTAPYLPCTDCTFDPQGSLNDEDMQNLAEWGFNMVRLGVMWVAVEPSPGQYNYTFLSEAVALVNKLASYNITTLIDMHQDLLSPATCGEGIPSWVSELATTSRACNESWYAETMHAVGVCKSITEYSIPIDPSTGFPSAVECVKHNFALFYATPEVASSFQSLFTNHAGIADAFRAYWSVTAKAFSGIASVIGYDLLNEPFVGDLWSDLSEIALPGHSDNKYLQPLYASLHDVIREVDKEHLLFYEPTPLPDTLPLFGGIVSPVGFNATPGTAAGQGPNQDVLSYHVYCCVSAANACDAAGNPTNGAVCDVYNPKNVATRMSDIARLGGGGFLTEFGACTDGAACIDEIARTTQAADDHFQSWAYWQFKYMHDVTTSSGPAEGFYSPTDGSLVVDKVAALSRTYAQVVQGTPLAMRFNSTTMQFDLTYLSSATATGPTIIYMNRAMNYPRAVSVNVLQGAGVVATTVDANHIQINHPPGLPAGTTVQVQIVMAAEGQE